MVKTGKANKPHGKNIYKILSISNFLNLYNSVPHIGISDPNSRLINRERHERVG